MGYPISPNLLQMADASTADFLNATKGTIQAGIVTHSESALGTSPAVGWPEGQSSPPLPFTEQVWRGFHPVAMNFIHIDYLRVLVIARAKPP